MKPTKHWSQWVWLLSGNPKSTSHLRFTFSFGCWWASSALSTWDLLLSIKRKPRRRTVMKLWWASALTCSSAQSLLVSQTEAQAIHDIWMALGNLLHTPKTECLVWEQDILTITHTPSRDAKLTGSVSFIKGRFHKNWHQRMWFLVPLSKFCPSSYRYWVLSRGKATSAMFDSADSLEWALHSTGRPHASSHEAPAQTQTTGWRGRNKVHVLKDYSGPPHRDTKHHEMPRDWQEQLENRRHETTFISCYLPFPSPTLGCIPQESQPGSAGSLMESSATRVARSILFLAYFAIQKNVSD